MKKRYLLPALMGLLAVFLVVSCTSTPPPGEAAPPVETPAPPPAAPVPSPAVPETPPAPTQPPAPPPAPTQPPEPAAAPAQAEAESLLDQMAQAREDALAAGAGARLPDHLAGADEAAAEARAAFDGKDYEEARDKAGRAGELYRILGVLAQAGAARDEIQEKGFEGYDPEGIAQGAAAHNAALAAYEAGSLDEARDKAGEALQRYRQALDTAWKTYAGERRAAADEERQKALDLKADVAVKADFNEAGGFYTQAGAAYEAGDYSQAVDAYIEAEYRFTATAAIAEEKRRQAQEAIRVAEERTAASEETLKNAEAALAGEEGGAE